jgi:hypothetical protein
MGNFAIYRDMTPSEMEFLARFGFIGFNGRLDESVTMTLRPFPNILDFPPSLLNGVSAFFDLATVSRLFPAVIFLNSNRNYYISTSLGLINPNGVKDFTDIFEICWMNKSTGEPHSFGTELSLLRVCENQKFDMIKDMVWNFENVLTTDNLRITISRFHDGVSYSSRRSLRPFFTFPKYSTVDELRMKLELQGISDVPTAIP